jgi:hypothetical protein
VRQELCKFEQLNDAKNYKFGVLYCKTDQVKEGEMYANNKTSQDYEEFLDLLGERVPLKGWEKFGGGLDLGPTESTGTESIYLEIFDDYQVMYHVATLIPYKEDDEQQIDRKRHLGNDIVIIVFKEGTQKFDPTVIKSQFNQLFFVVQKEQRYDGVYYRLQIVNKAGIPPYPPYLPDPPVFVKGDEFRNFLLTKLINGERATIKESPNFKHKLMATRKSLLGEIVKTFSKPRRGSVVSAVEAGRTLRRTLSTKLMRRKSSAALPKLSRDQEDKDDKNAEGSSSAMQLSIASLKRAASRTISGPTSQGASQWNYNPLTPADAVQQPEKLPSLEAPGKLVSTKTDITPRSGEEAEDKLGELPNMDMPREKRLKPRRRTMPPLTRHKKDPADTLQ